jgi:hypothetical protein
MLPRKERLKAAKIILAYLKKFSMGRIIKVYEIKIKANQEKLIMKKGES